MCVWDYVCVTGQLGRGVTAIDLRSRAVGSAMSTLQISHDEELPSSARQHAPPRPRSRHHFSGLVRAVGLCVCVRTITFELIDSLVFGMTVQLDTVYVKFEGEGQVTIQGQKRKKTC